MNSKNTDETAQDPVEVLRGDEETIELFERIANSDAQCASRFQNALDAIGRVTRSE